MPPTVVRALLDNREFAAFAELSALSYGNIGSFRHRDIVHALERARGADGKADLTTQRGRRFVLSRLPEGRGAVLTEDDAEDRVIPEFGFLDPEQSNRLKALVVVEGKCWPGLPSASMWRSLLMDRPLDETELARLISDIRDVPSQFIAVSEEKWMSGAQMGPEEFFPTSLTYYSALACPPPQAKTMDEWIAATLMPDLKRGIERSVSDGLRRALTLNIDSRLSPATLVIDVPNEELLLALGDLVQTVSPFALLGVLEIALTRIGKDGRFVGLVSDALDRLFGTQSRTNGIEASWRVLPALVKAGLGKFGTDENLWGHPLFWRRLAAHAHANVLVEFLDAEGSNVDRFVDWLNGLGAESEVAAHILDMRDEPLWRAWDLSPRQIRASVIARLMSLKGPIDQLGLGTIVDSAIDALKSEYGQFDAERPGPLVVAGTRMADLPDRQGTSTDLVSQCFLQARADLEVDPMGPAWKALSITCRLLRFDGELLERLANVVGRITIVDSDDGANGFLETLWLAADIGATQPYEPVARNVADVLIGSAGRFSGEVAVATGLRVLVFASGAFRERDRGMEWLADQICGYAFAIPRGLPCRRLLFELEALQTLLPIRDRYFGKARKVAAAGIE